MISPRLFCNAVSVFCTHPSHPAASVLPLNADAWALITVCGARRGPNYLEVDVDVASSSVAATVVGLVQGATKALVVDMGVVLEGHTSDELPERCAPPLTLLFFFLLLMFLYSSSGSASCGCRRRAKGSQINGARYSYLPSGPHSILGYNLWGGEAGEKRRRDGS